MNLKYVQKAGDRYRYRRKVPQALRAALRKGEIITPLGRSEAEVAMRYQAVHSAAERELADALNPPRPKPVVTVTDLQQFQEARKRVRQLGFDPQHVSEGTGEWYARGNVADDKVLQFGKETVDTTGAYGRLMLNMFAAFAEFERDLMKERQKEGIAKAKAECKYKGRKPTARAKAGEAVSLYQRGKTVSEVSKELGIGRGSVYRALEAAGLKDAAGA